jgi:hypothetical protein
MATMDTALAELISKGGVIGLLIGAVYYITNKLNAAYEARITALERSSEICEKDRVELRNMILNYYNPKTGRLEGRKPMQSPE